MIHSSCNATSYPNAKPPNDTSTVSALRSIPTTAPQSNHISAPSSNQVSEAQRTILREAPVWKRSGLFGHCPNGGGVSTLAQMVWGTYFEKNCPCSKGHLLGLGGLNPCQDGLGHLCSENWSSNGICSSRSGNKVPQSARLSEGGGGQSLFGQCPNRPGIFLTGASLTDEDEV